MTNQDEVREFLSTRRARLTPQAAGLSVYGGRRRVPGLRREEVALLAGVSVHYYNRMERGSLAGTSDSVLNAVAGALQLNEAEREHLYDLARTASAPSAAQRARVSSDRLRPSIVRLLDAFTDGPALIRNRYFDYVGANTLGRALYAQVFTGWAGNSARFAFCDPAARDLYHDWDRVVRELVATMRQESGRTPGDRKLSGLVGELGTRSDEFRVLWGAHDVRRHCSAVKQLHHPVVGDLELTFEALDFPADPGLTLLTYTAEPGTPSADALRLLASWASTEQVANNGS